MRRSLLVLLVVSLALSLSSCGGSGSAGKDGAPSAAVAPSADQLASAVQAAAKSAPWGASITSVAVVKRFRLPVIHVVANTDDAGATAIIKGLQGVLGEKSPSGPWFAEVFPNTGMEQTTSQGITRIGPAAAPKPADPSGIKEWIDKTYGSTSGDPVDEKWYASIKSMSYDAASKSVVVNVSYPKADPEAKFLCYMIVCAVDEPFFADSGDAFTWVKIIYSDGGEYLARNKVRNRYVP
jgi:hypothetical protein